MEHNRQVSETYSTKSDQLFRQALAVERSGKKSTAVEIYKEVLRYHPTHIDTIINLGVLYYEDGNFSGAIEIYRQGLSAQPKNSLLHYNLGLVLQNSGELDTAIISYQKSIESQPENANAFNNIGIILMQRGDYSRALEAFQRAIDTNPAYAEVYDNIGRLLEEMGQPEDAIASYQQALSINPQLPSVHNNIGLVYKALGQLDESVLSFQKAIDINPNYAGVHSNLGSVLADQGKISPAFEVYKKALRLNPDLAEAYGNIGRLLLQIGQVDKAVKLYQQACKLAPKSSVIHSNALYAFLHATDFSTGRLSQKHIQWGKQFHVNSTHFRTDAECGLRGRSKIHIGYVSPDFRQHAWSYFIEPILLNHNKERIKVFCYANVIRKDKKTEYFKSISDHWRDISCLSDEQARDMMANDQIDILVNLAGHTSQNRLSLFSLKSAPIQVILGHYQCTTGLSSIDYRLTDQWVDPPESEGLYLEKFSYLAYGSLCYSPPSDGPAIYPVPAEEKGYLTFCCLNRLSKINHNVISVWSELLQGLPKSRLLLKDKWFSDSHVKQQVHNIFNSYGITSKRLTLLPSVETYREHLDLYNQVDIALDTYPVNGQTTSCESLWMGVPVVTLMGNRCSQRFGYSLLSRLGLDELVSYSEQEYILKARKLALDRDQRLSLRFNLRSKMKEKICDASTFVQQLEQSYCQMINHYMRNKSD